MKIEIDKQEVIKSTLNGDGNILTLQAEINRAIKKGFKKYHIHLQNSGNTPYVQMIEFIRDKTEKEILSEEKKLLENRLREINNRLTS